MDAEVKKLLDAVREFQEDRELTVEEAAALDAALSQKNYPKIEVRPLPSRRDRK